MITIKTYQRNSKQYKDIYSTNSILIIGQGMNENKLNEIYKPYNEKDMIDTYGYSSLTYSYIDAVNAGAINVFVLNAFKTTDYIRCIDLIKYYEFSYVVPIDLNLSDKFYSERYNKDMYYAEYYLKEFSANVNSQIIFTDKHAEYYADIDAYLNDMHYIVEKFRNDCYYLLSNYGDNLLFCLNSLNTVKNSNVSLAAALAETVPGNYPDTINSNSVFDINSNDIHLNEIIYFKNNDLIPTSIENLKNFKIKNDANKLVIINSVIRYIEKSIDLSNVIGRYYNEYLKIYVLDNLNEMLRKMININIRDFKITDIKFIKNKETKTGYFLVSITIYFLNMLEDISLMLEVK